MTMMESFCAAGNFKALLQRTDLPVFKKCEIVIQRATREGPKPMPPTFLGDPHLNHSDCRPNTKNQTNKMKPLGSRVMSALKAKQDTLCADIEGWLPPEKAFFHQRYSVHDAVYSTNAASSRDSTIFFQPSDSDCIVPGKIREIFCVPTQSRTTGIFREDVFLAVERFQEYEGSGDPFTSHGDFGAGLWSMKMVTELEIIRITQPICHGIYRKWGQGAFVMKPLIKVCACCIHSYGLAVLTLGKAFGKNFV
jgi:hypothetical protein